ncbi:MAG TPA: hypothetical protein PLM29_00685 [Deltaproteobacteria bacterium]|nr:hypothetical protein [Deltaproteobacteria bacterium]
MDERAGTRLKAAREIMTGLSEQGIRCDLFKANRIMVNLWTAYQKGAKEDPGMMAAVLNGEFQIKGGVA